MHPSALEKSGFTTTLNMALSSTAPERSTVAELWTNRSWKLFQQWSLAPAASWTAPGILPADGAVTER